MILPSLHLSVFWLYPVLKFFKILLKEKAKACRFSTGLGFFIAYPTFDYFLHFLSFVLSLYLRKELVSRDFPSILSRATVLL